MTKVISDLQYITQETRFCSHVQLAELACSGGVRWVQLRIKGKTDDVFLQLAQKVKAVCEKYGSRLIINDNVGIAKTVAADGVHLGKEDMHPVKARQLLGENSIIGGTANTIEDILLLSAYGVDYIGLGPFRFTSTKEKLSPILGLEAYVKLVRACQKQNITTPLIAIGGIKIEDVSLLMETGIHGIAVSSAINLAADPAKSAKEFLTGLHGCRKELTEPGFIK